MATTKRKSYIMYKTWVENNPTWFEDTFPDYDQFKLATFKAIVYKWYQFRYLCTYDEEKFEVYFQRMIENTFDRWCELTSIEALRVLQESWENLSKYNATDYAMTSTGSSSDTGTRTNTGTVTDAGTSSVDNTGTQKSLLTLDTDTDSTTNSETKNTGTTTTANTGTVTDAGTTTDHTTSSGTDNTTTNADNRNLASNLPQSITAEDGKFATHFDGKRDSEGEIQNYQTGWVTANAKSEGISTGTESNTTAGTSDSNGTTGNTRTDDLEQVTTDNTTQATDTDYDTKRTGTEDTTRTDNLHQAGTTSNTRTDNLSENTTNNGTTNNSTNYTVGGRTNHNPSEIVLDALRKITQFCSTDWLVVELQPCFLQVVIWDDWEDDLEDE